jgi:hypothetical protein
MLNNKMEPFSKLKAFWAEINTKLERTYNKLRDRENFVYQSFHHLEPTEHWTKLERANVQKLRKSLSLKVNKEAGV